MRESGSRSHLGRVAHGSLAASCVLAGRETIILDNINRSGSIDVDALIHALKEAVNELLTRPEVIALLAINLSPLKVLTRPQVIALLGVSKTIFERLEAKGLGPPKIMLADRRIGYRV